LLLAAVVERKPKMPADVLPHVGGILFDQVVDESMT
jgi:hypothetical protein